MAALEIVMKRDDPDIAWGFRLTGGADLGTLFYVVKVLGRGHAERAGLLVGDMVYAINHQYINKYTHKDAQNAILHTGDTLILNIRRGPLDGRGTPLPEYVDPLMGLAPVEPTPRPKPVPPPPYEPPAPVIKEPTPPESEDDEEGGEDTVAAFNVKINPKGRIAAIEELPVTPPPSRSSSRCRSRSRSASAPRERRSSAKRENGIRGPGETFTYSKEVVTQYTQVLSASERQGGETSETINESFIIHGGSNHNMEDVLSPEDIEKDIFEEKMEEQKITELLTGEAELLDQGIVGINFQKIMPKTDFIKESNVFKKVRFQEESDKGEQKEERCTIQEQTSVEEQASETKLVEEKVEEVVEYKSEFERQLAEIRKQMQSIQELPSVLQANLTALQEQLTRIVDAKAAADQAQSEETESRSRRDSGRSQLQWKIDVTVEEKKDECDEETVEVEKSEPATEETHEEKNYVEEELDSEVDKVIQNEQYENMKNQQNRQREDDEFSVSRPPLIRNFPRKVAERPIVLPGGRKWYKPRDAYNEDFIAETIIHQSEVLVGTTIGLNFLKYEPPKFDSANSAVFRLVHEIENKGKGDVGLPIEGRPEKLLAEEDYFPPISKRHFFAARLTEHGNENVEKILKDTNEEDIVSV